MKITFLDNVSTLHQLYRKSVDYQLEEKQAISFINSGLAKITEDPRFEVTPAKVVEPAPAKTKKKGKA